MKKIPVTPNLTALIDDEDYELVSQYKWWSTPRGYPYTQHGGRENRTTVLMHRLIMGAKSGQEIDHKNRNILDNRRDNLRFCTRSQNNANRKPLSDHKGARWTRNGWQAEIKVSGRNIYLGRYKKVEDATEAYRTAAKKYYGEFASYGATRNR